MRRFAQPALVSVTLLALVLLAAAACTSSGPATPAPTGTLSGTVSIGPLCPVEPCTVTTNPFEGLEVVISHLGGTEAARILVQPTGSYSGVVPSGEIAATLEPCEWLGCQFGFPLTTSVAADGVTTLDFDIDTGIR